AICAVVGWPVGAASREGGGEAPVEIERNGARLALRMNCGGEAERLEDGPEAEPAVAEEGQLALFAALEDVAAPPPAPRLAPRVVPAEPPLHRVRRLSFTSLSTFEQCSYKYYALRVAGMAERRAERREAEGDGGLRATEIGDAVHRLLEQVDLSAPAEPDVEQVRGWYTTVSDEELERIRGFVAAYCESELARR